VVEGGKILDTTNIVHDILTHVDENIDKWHDVPSSNLNTTNNKEITWTRANHINHTH